MPVMVRRRRPLLRAAGAAALGGAAYNAGRRHGEPAPPPGPASYPPPGPPGPGLSEQAVTALAELGRLHEQGVLTDAEFEEQKRRYLAG